MMMTYTEYTVRLSNEPSYYGSGCSQEKADNIVDNLSERIRCEFEGINVELFKDGEHSTCMAGPDEQTCREIEDWIAENWTVAL